LAAGVDVPALLNFTIYADPYNKMVNISRTVPSCRPKYTY